MLVYCAGVPWDSVPGTDRRLVEQLARHVQVLWVDPPTSVVRAAASPHRFVRSLTEVAPSIRRLRTLTPPFPQRAPMVGPTARVIAASVRWATSYLGSAPQAVLVSCAEPRPGIAGPGVPYGYYATDDFVAGADLLGLSQSRLLRAEAAQLEMADVVFAISPEVTSRWGDSDRARQVLLPNGCDPSHMAEVPAPPHAGSGGPIAGVVGQLSDRIDLTLLEAVADRGVSMLLVGPATGPLDRPRFDALTARANVRWVGAVDYRDLPGWLAAMSVGLTPYADSPFNRASFPLKTLEYLAAGRAVVSSRLPSVARLSTDLIAVGDGPAGFADATVAALAHPFTTQAMAARRRFANAHSWETRARTVLRGLNLQEA